MQSTTVAPQARQSQAGLGGWVRGIGRRTWRAMEETGKVRAQRHLLDFASQCEGLQPELAKELRAASGALSD